MQQLHSEGLCPPVRLRRTRPGPQSRHKDANMSSTSLKQLNLNYVLTTKFASCELQDASYSASPCLGVLFSSETDRIAAHHLHWTIKVGRVLCTVYIVYSVHCTLYTDNKTHTGQLGLQCSLFMVPVYTWPIYLFHCMCKKPHRLELR